MKKRVISAFSVACGLTLMLDFSVDQLNQQTQIAESDSYDVEFTGDVSSASLTAGIISASAVDIDESVASASVVDSEIVTTAASLGALYGYSNIGICKVESGNLNIREAASKDSKLVGKFPKDAGCEVIGQEGDWLLIKSGDIQGYVLAEYILTGDSAWEEACSLAQLVATAKTGGLRVREAANTECDILVQLAAGEEVTVIEEGDEWVKVEVDGEEGYVFAEYVDVELSLRTAMTLAQARYGADVSSVRVGICDEALKYVGNPYVWGGTSLTRGADCSGFVLSIYKMYGISLPHSSRAQANCGKKISSSELQPGDLIFYGKGKSINHVAIYIGGGQICHASNRRDGIKISNAFYRTPVKCVRLINE